MKQPYTEEDTHFRLSPRVAERFALVLESLYVAQSGLNKLETMELSAAIHRVIMTLQRIEQHYAEHIQ